MVVFRAGQESGIKPSGMFRSAVRRDLLVVALVSACFVIAAGCGGGGSTASAPPPSAPPPSPDFTIASKPSSLSLVLGTAQPVQITAKPLNGFSGTISLNDGSLPAGVTVSPALPQDIGPSGLNLSIAAAANAPTGTSTILMSATSGSLQHPVNIGLTMANRANVFIDLPPGKVDVAQAGNASVAIDVNASGGIVDFNVLLQVVAPSGVTATLSNSNIPANTAVNVSLAASSSAITGPNTITLLATRSVDGVQVSADLPIYVDPAAGRIPGNRANWVRMGSNPSAVYYDSKRNHILASLPASNRVDVVDPTSGNLLSSIPVGVAGYEPNGKQLKSSSNLSSTLDGKSLLALGVGHISTIDLASMRVVGSRPLPMATFIGRTTPSPIFPSFLVAAAGGHMVLGSWGDSSFYNWDGVSNTASLHLISDLYSFDRNFDGTKVLVASGDSSGSYQLLDVASDSLTGQGAYSNAFVMTVRGNPVRDEWAVANSNGIDFLDHSLNLIARVPGFLVGSLTYWGMTYRSDGNYLYFVYSPTGLPFLITVDTTSHSVVRIAPATGTTLAYFRREPSEWVVQPFAADNNGLVFGLGEKGLVIDDSTYQVDPNQATSADFAIIATPDSGPKNGPTAVQITTQSYSAQPDVWFGVQRALVESLNASGQVSATAPTAQSSGPVNIRLFPPDGYAHLMPQAFTYGTILTSVRNSICPANGGCTADIFGFGLFGSDRNRTTVTIGGNSAPVQSVHYFNGDQPYPYPLQYVSVMVPPGLAGRADVTVKTAVGQATLPGGFTYAVSLQSYPSAQTYNALLYDEKRNVLYASTDSAISRYSVSSSSFLTPITPPSISGQNQFEGMSLTPDGSRLLVANKHDLSVAVIDPDNPASAQAIAVSATMVNPAGPVFVAATSAHKAIISLSGFTFPYTGSLFELDLNTSHIQPLTIPDAFASDSTRLSSTSDGSTVLVGGGYFWSAASRQFSSIADGFPGSGPSTAAGDGNVFAVGQGFIAPDGTSLVGEAIPDELGGSFNFFPNDSVLNDSGSLIFIPNGKSLLIFDSNHGDVLRSVSLPNQVNVWTKVIALNSTAQQVFLSDSQGLTVLNMAAAPLAIGSLSPSSVSSTGSSTVTVRGSGFNSGTAITIGGKAATSVFVDPNTLQVTTPANPAGRAQMIVENPDGETYTLDAAILYQ